MCIYKVFILLIIAIFILICYEILMYLVYSIGKFFFYNYKMFVSILMTSYNYENYIKEAVESVLAQSFNDWELIIVDDASLDSSVQIISVAAESDKRVRTIVNDKNMGLEASLAKALKYSSGKWIAILESDDSWTPEYLEEKIKVILKNPEAGVIFNDVELVGEDSGIELIVNTNRRFLADKNFPRNMFADFNLRNRIMTFSSVMIRRDLLEAVNWNTPSDRLLDWWIYIQLAYSNKFYYIDKKLTKWRIHSDSYINRKGPANCIMTNVLAMIEIFRKKPSIGLFFFILYTIPAFIFVKILKKFFVKEQ